MSRRPSKGPSTPCVTGCSASCEAEANGAADRPPHPAQAEARLRPASAPAGEILQGALHDGLQLLVVRALPVGATALRALGEDVVRALGAVLELVGHLVLRGV